MRAKPYFYSYKYPCHINMSKWASSIDGTEDITIGMDTFDLLKFYLTVDGVKIDIQSIDFINKDNITLNTVDDAEFLENCVVGLTGTDTHDMKIRITEVVSRREFKAETYDLNANITPDIVSKGKCYRSCLGWTLLYEADDEMILKPNNPNINNCIYLYRITDFNGFDVNKLKSKIFNDNFTANINKGNSRYYDNIDNNYLLTIHLWNYDSSLSIDDNINNFEVLESGNISNNFHDTKLNYLRVLFNNKALYNDKGADKDIYDKLDWCIYGDDKYFLFGCDVNRGKTSYNFVSFGELPSINNSSVYIHIGNSITWSNGNLDFNKYAIGSTFGFNEWKKGSNMHSYAYGVPHTIINVTYPNDNKIKYTAKYVSSFTDNDKDNEMYSNPNLLSISFLSSYWIYINDIYNNKIPLIKLPLVDYIDIEKETKIINFSNMKLGVYRIFGSYNHNDNDFKPSNLSNDKFYTISLLIETPFREE